MPPKNSRKSKKTTEMVIARYNEDLTWLKDVPKDIKITVYNKGQSDLNIPSIPLPNVGRESHTYLYHIVKNYHQLADQTIFCQGDSIFHSPDFLKLLKHRHSFEPIQPMSAWYWPEGEPPNFFSNPPLPALKKTENIWLNKCQIHVEYLDNNFVTQYPIHYQENSFVRYVNRVKELYGITNPLAFNKERFNITDLDLNELFPICYAGLFCVDRDVVHQRCVDFYNNILSIILYDDMRYMMPEKKLDHGLFLEKLWLVIFNYKKNNKNFIQLFTKDFPNDNIDLTLIQKQTQFSFEYYSYYSQLYIEIDFDHVPANIFISRYYLTMNINGRTLIKIKPFETNKTLDKILYDEQFFKVDGKLENQTFTLSINGYPVIKTLLSKRNQSKKYQHITRATVFEMANDNHFHDHYQK